jgi:excinuclease UvrABC nuclease subunit
MRRLSRELAFEDAARVRDRIIAMRKRLAGEDTGEDDAVVALAIAAAPPRKSGTVRNYRRTRRGP